MHTPTEIKLELAASAEEKKKQFEDLSLAIFHHPELALHEYKAQQTLCDFLEANGFQAQRGLGSLDTSFEAVYDSGAAGRRVAFLAEYDALPKLGHACGHNLIGASAAGAGVILKDAMQKHGVGGVLKVIGTPAEECVGGKVIMLREGVFDGLDAAISTGTSVEICQKGETLKNIRNDRRLVHIFRANMELIGEPYIERSLAQGIGSTDVGNVTHEIPAIQAYIGLKAGVGTHTAEFARAAGGPEGARALSAAIQILAMSGLDVLIN